AVFLDDLCDGVLDGCRVGDVQPEGFSGPTVRALRQARYHGARVEEVCADHDSALAGERVGDPLAEPACRPGDQTDPVVQSTHLVVSSFIGETGRTRRPVSHRRWSVLLVRADLLHGEAP